jgi:hypothetical protein
MRTSSSREAKETTLRRPSRLHVVAHSRARLTPLSVRPPLSLQARWATTIRARSARRQSRSRCLVKRLPQSVQRRVRPGPQRSQLQRQHRRRSPFPSQLVLHRTRTRLLRTAAQLRQMESRWRRRSRGSWCGRSNIIAIRGDHELVPLLLYCFDVGFWRGVASVDVTFCALSVPTPANLIL